MNSSECADNSNNEFFEIAQLYLELFTIYKKLHNLELISIQTHHDNVCMGFLTKCCIFAIICTDSNTSYDFVQRLIVYQSFYMDYLPQAKDLLIKYTNGELKMNIDDDVQVIDLLVTKYDSTENEPFIRYRSTIPIHNLIRRKSLQLNLKIIAKTFDNCTMSRLEQILHKSQQVYMCFFSLNQTLLLLKGARRVYRRTHC